MPTDPVPGGRVLHVLAAYDPKEAQGRSIRTIASGVNAQHFLACGHLVDGGDEFAAVVETGAGPTEFGRRDRGRLADIVRRVRPDVVHFHGGPLGAAAMASGWTGDVPVTASIYAWTRVGHRSFGRGVAVSDLRRTPVLAGRSVLNTVVPHTAIGAALRRAGVRAITTPDPAVRAALAAQAIPVGVFDGITEPRPVADRRPIPGHLVFAGRAELTRGPDVLARAVDLLRRRGRNVSARFCLLGTPAPDLVAHLTATSGCTVSIGGTDLDAEMALATAVVLPFRFDDTTLAPALVATEAMAGGVPVIGGDVRCIRAAVDDGVTGLLVTPDDVVALAAAIDRLAGDPAFAEQLGRNAAAEIERRWQTSSIVDLARWSYDVALTGARVSCVAATTPPVPAPGPPMTLPTLPLPEFSADASAPAGSVLVPQEVR